LEIIDRISPYY